MGVQLQEKGTPQKNFAHYHDICEMVHSQKCQYSSHY
jgi:hypothetical protein